MFLYINIYNYSSPPPSPYGSHRIRLGDRDLDSVADDSTALDVAAKKFSRHVGYKRPEAYFDVAVVHLEKTISFTGGEESYILYYPCTLVRNGCLSWP